MPRYGRILFYDDRDGEVLLDTGQMEGDVPPIDPEFYYQILEKQFKNRDNISYKQLEWDQDIDKFGKFPDVRVTPSGELLFTTKESKYRIGIKNTMTDRWWPLFEQEYKIYNEEEKWFDVEKLAKFYNDFINYNFRTVCNTVQVRWLYPTKIDRYNSWNENLIVHWNNEMFPSKEEFAKEMLDYGMIFPIQARVRDNWDKYDILDGSHRIFAIHSLINDGLWPKNKNLLTIEFKTTNVNFVEVPEINYQLEKPVIMHIPKVTLPKYHFIPFISQREFNEDIVEVEVNRYLDMVLLFRMYVSEMTKSVIKCKQITGKIFPPARQINDEEYYYKWIKGLV